MSKLGNAISGMVNRPASVDKSSKINPMVFVALLGMVLLGVTGYHSAHLLMQTVASDMTLIAIAGLAAFDIGFLLWPFTVKSPHSNPSQKAIGILMTGLCGLAVCLAFLSDVAMTMNLDIAGQPWFRGAVVVLVSAAVLSNVIAFIAYHLCSGWDGSGVTYTSTPNVIPDVDYDKIAQKVMGLLPSGTKSDVTQMATVGSDSPVALPTETKNGKRPKA